MPHPPNADDSVFHDTARTADAPMVRSFTDTIEIGFTVTTTDYVNVSTLLKIFLSFALKNGHRILNPAPTRRQPEYCMAK
jgi:hypothetical protein